MYGHAQHGPHASIATIFSETESEGVQAEYKRGRVGFRDEKKMTTKREREERPDSSEHRKQTTNQDDKVTENEIGTE